MTPKRWEDLIGKIKDKFTVLEHHQFHLDQEGGTELEDIIFKGPLGKTKLEFTAKPLVVDKKTTYSRRIGSTTKVDYLYSPTEKSYKLKVYRWDSAQDDWLEMEAKNLNL